MLDRKIGEYSNTLRTNKKLLKEVMENLAMHAQKEVNELGRSTGPIEKGIRRSVSEMGGVYDWEMEEAQLPIDIC